MIMHYNIYMHSVDLPAMGLSLGTPGSAVIGEHFGYFIVQTITQLHTLEW